MLLSLISNLTQSVVEYKYTMKNSTKLCKFKTEYKSTKSEIFRGEKKRATRYVAVVSLVVMQ